MTRRLVTTSSLLAVWWCPELSIGWDGDGMAAIGMTAMSGIKPEALNELKRLLGGKDIVDVSHWTYNLVAKYPDLQPIFEQPQTADFTHPQDCSNSFQPDCLYGNCLLGALNHFYHKLVGVTPQPANHSFNLPIPLKLSDVDMMKLTLGLIGELHSPMKFGYINNRLGKEIRITYNEHTGKSTNVQTTLYKYWESDLIQKTIKDRPHFWYSGWTHVNGYRRGFYQEEQKDWDSAGPDKSAVFAKWANETYFGACTRCNRKMHRMVSRSPQGANPGADPDTPEEQLLVPMNHHIPPNSIYMDFEFLKQKILIAGTRMAIVMNFILQSKSAPKLRQGTSVNVQDVRPAGFGRANAMHSKGGYHWLKNIGINSFLIIIVVGVFALFVKFSSDGARTISQRRIELTKEKD